MPGSLLLMLLSGGGGVPGSWRVGGRCRLGFKLESADRTRVVLQKEGVQTGMSAYAWPERANRPCIQP